LQVLTCMRAAAWRRTRRFAAGRPRVLGGAMGKILAIATRRFDAPSATFIRDHVRTLAPRATVLICQKGDAHSLSCPVLSGVPSNSPTDCHRVVTFLRREKVDVMLAEYATSAVHFIHACKQANVRLYVHVHGFDVSVYLPQPLWVNRYRELFTHASGIIAPSRFLADKLAAIGCPTEKLHVSPNGVDPERFQPGAPGDPFRLLAVGRFVEKKAPHLTIRAFADVLARFPEARLDMIGDGPLAETCLALVRESGLSEKVRLLGVQSPGQVANAMREASLFVQHSVTTANGDTEGLPVAILEAMASALPVVATRHSGIPEAIVDGATGILVDEYDVFGMTQAIISLLANPTRAKAMGEAGRQRVLAHFTQTQTRDRLRAIMGLFPLRTPLSEFLSRAWREANDKARELGWIV
jgi:colanic acid/amylovoran biosynthesis glycosyltransferase